MAVFTRYIANLLRDVTPLLADWHCCTVGVFLAATLCFGLLLLLLNIMPNLLAGARYEHRTARKSNRVKSNMDRKSPARSTIHEAKLNGGWRQKAVKFWPSPGFDYDCVVPCINCSVTSSDKLCRYVLCKLCCQASAATVCGYHGNQPATKQAPSCGWSRHKPTRIDLSYSSLEKFPDRVGFIGCQLHTLNLSNNQLHDLPLEIGCLLGLQHLDLHSNSIKQLPSIIGNFVHLRELDVSSNRLTSLPENIGNLKRLQQLRLCKNNLTQLPATIGLLRQLQKLHISKNRIADLPIEVGKLANIEVIQMRKNRLRDIGNIMGQLVRLESLDVSGNDLEVLPSGVVRCASLTRLRLQNNRIRLLPNQIGHLHQLRDLKVDNNRLRYLPASLHGLQLYVFSVEGNPLLTRGSPGCEVFGRTQRQVVFPSLVELCARNVTVAGMAWKECHMPASLKDLLGSVNYCQSCESPVFDNCSSQLLFRKISGIENVPLCQHRCGLYHSRKCTFIQVGED